MTTEVKVPTLGESIAEATLGQWLKKPGDPVKADEPVASLETDKVAIEVPSPVDGVMGEQVVAEGESVEVGAVIARIEAGDGAAAAPELPESTPVNPAGAGENIEVKQEEAGRADEESHLTLSPAVRRVVLEHHLDPSRIRGTGKDGRLTKDDVLAAAKTQRAEAPAPAAPAQPAAPAEAAAPVP
ncbi:MAG TPA: biotin/lipoyl-containing protein, partial [Allosphingosinicella sp.]|nr:biotin/lipoyl-containing protein [Allosphingosinicella sp.]